MSLKDAFKNLFNTSKEVSVEKAAEVKVQASAKFESVKEFSSDLADKVEDAVDDVKQSATEVGAKARDLGESLLDKAEAALDNAKEKTAEVFENIEEKAEDAVNKLESKIRESAKPKTEEPAMDEEPSAVEKNTENEVEHESQPIESKKAE